MTESIHQSNPELLRKLQIDVQHKSAQHSLEWQEKLSNPNLAKQFGRRILNRVGITSPEQKALQFHEGVLENYASFVGVEPNEVANVTPDLHRNLRDAAIDREVADGEVVRDEDRREPLATLKVGTIHTPAPRKVGIKDYIRAELNPKPMPEGVWYRGIRRKLR